MISPLRPLAFQSIRWRLIVSSLLAICVPLSIFAWWIGTMLWNFYLRQLEQELRSVAWIIAESAEPMLAAPTIQHDELVQLAAQWDRHSRIRLVVADAKGVVHAATVPSLVGARVSEDRTPGLVDALHGHANATVWKHPDYDYQDTMYVNVPVTRGERVVGGIRVSFGLDQIEEKLGLLETTLLTGVGGYMGLIVVLTVILASSIVKPVEALTRSARILAGGDLAHRASSYDTSEMNQLSATMNQMAERLQALEEARRQYVSDVSHELRAPLASIRGMAETVLQHGAADPELRARYLPRVVSQTERLARLATQLLDLAQIESGTIARHLSPVDLKSVVDEAVNTAVTQKRATSDIAVQTRVDPGLPPFLGDRDRLAQMLINLLDNAVRHTPAGGRVSIAAGRDGDQVLLEVADTGPGIPADHLPHIFERFYRVDRARNAAQGGSGLGLSIVRQIVQSHSGDIQVISQPGKGTRFLVRLPLKESEAATCTRPRS